MERADDDHGEDAHDEDSGREHQQPGRLRDAEHVHGGQQRQTDETHEQQMV